MEFVQNKSPSFSLPMYSFHNSVFHLILPTLQSLKPKIVVNFYFFFLLMPKSISLSISINCPHTFLSYIPFYLYCHSYYSNEDLCLLSYLKGQDIIPPHLPIPYFKHHLIPSPPCNLSFPPQTFPNFSQLEAISFLRTLL